MDYAFVPGIEDYHVFAKKMIDRRSNTILINISDVKTIKEFISYLESSNQITRPVGDLWILTHANDAGILKAYLDDDANQDTDFEEVDRLLKDPNRKKSVNIPEALRKKSDGTLADINLHIRGCRIGKGKIFLQKLKEAFAGVKSITAPNFRHMAVKMVGNELGYIEHLSHDFQINYKEKNKDRKKLIKDFKEFKDNEDKGFRFYDDKTYVPDDFWETWIPKNLKNEKPKFDACVGGDECPKGKKIKDLTSIPIAREYKSRPGIYVFYADTGSEPSNYKKEFTESLESSEIFQPNYPDPQNPYPVYQRYGYRSAQDFIDGYKWYLKWKFAKSVNKKVLICTGIRQEYHVYIPIVDLPQSIDKPNDLEKGQLFFNFYPNKGINLKQIDELNEKNNLLFTTV